MTNNIRTHYTTEELLLLQRYSKLVEAVEAENKALRELLEKKSNDYILMYNSRDRYKTLYSQLVDKVQRLTNTL